mmetsp:Transcript_18342/g.55352  ORF Transcript_18342/g.55352 Transcript_18342/m.55352 type:complete len:373 (-) Transcript_18342:554-1672(-)
MCGVTPSHSANASTTLFERAATPYPSFGHSEPSSSTSCGASCMGAKASSNILYVPFLLGEVGSRIWNMAERTLELSMGLTIFNTSLTACCQRSRDRSSCNTMSDGFGGRFMGDIAVSRIARSSPIPDRSTSCPSSSPSSPSSPADTSARKSSNREKRPWPPADSPRTAASIFKSAMVILAAVPSSSWSLGSAMSAKPDRTSPEWLASIPDFVEEMRLWPPESPSRRANFFLPVSERRGAGAVIESERFACSSIRASAASAGFCERRSRACCRRSCSASILSISSTLSVSPRRAFSCSMLTCSRSNHLRAIWSAMLLLIANEPSFSTCSTSSASAVTRARSVSSSFRPAASLLTASLAAARTASNWATAAEEA